MADTIKSSAELKLGSHFADNDTRTISLPNPKSTISATEINSIGAFCATNNIIIGDKGSAAFVRFDTAKVVEKEDRKLDLT